MADVISDRAAFDAARERGGGTLTGVRIDGLDLTGAALDRLTLMQVELVDCSLRGANLEAASLSHVRLRSCDLSGATLRDASLNEAVALDCQLTAAQVSGVTWQGGTLERVAARGLTGGGARARLHRPHGHWDAHHSGQ